MNHRVAGNHYHRLQVLINYLAAEIIYFPAFANISNKNLASCQLFGLSEKYLLKAAHYHVRN